MLPFKLIYSDDYYLPIGSHVFPAAEVPADSRAAVGSGMAEPRTFSLRSPLRTRTSCSSTRRNTSRSSRPARSLLAKRWRWKSRFHPNWSGHSGWRRADPSWPRSYALNDRVAVNIGGGFPPCLSGPWRRLLHDPRRRRRHPAYAARRQDPHGDDCRLRCSPRVMARRRFSPACACRAIRCRRRVAAPLAASLPAKVRNAHAGDVFTISLHQENNYPAWKPPSSIDVDLPDEIGDDEYLAWLDNALSSGLRQFEPELLCYIAGADPYREDQ